MKIFALLLLTCYCAVAQTTPDQDYTARVALANIRAVPRSGATATWLSGKLQSSPTGGLWPDALFNYAQISSDGSSCASTCGNSVHVNIPADFSFCSNTSLCPNPYGSWDHQPNTTGLIPLGTDLYFQFREKMDANYMAFESGALDGAKQFIYNPSDRVIDSATWANISGCSKLEIVQVDHNNLHKPLIYYSCAFKSVTNNPANGGGYEGIIPQRNADYLEQTAHGCNYSGADQGAPSLNVVSIARTSNVSTITTTTSVPAGWNVGDWIWVYPGNASLAAASNNILPVGTITGNSTQFAGIYQISAVSGSTISYNQLGINESITPTGNKVYHMTGYTTCWRYQPNEWATYQVHIRPGRDYYNDGNLHRDCTIEMWASHQDNSGNDLPSELVLSTTDYDCSAHDNQYGARMFQTISPSYSPPNLWWTNTGVYPQYGRLDLMEYQTNRCRATFTITNLARSGGVVTATVSPLTTDGAGRACFVNNVDQAVVTGTTLDGSSFNGTFTVTGTTGTTLIWSQAGSNISGAPGGATPQAQLPAYLYNCNGSTGGGCDTNVNFDQILFATHRIPDPKAGNTSPVPDPPDHLVVTSRTDATGAVSLRWVDNDANTPTFNLEACPDTGTDTHGGDRYQCYYWVGQGSNPWTTLATGITGSTGRYSTVTYTWTPPTTCNGSFQVPGSGSNACKAVVYTFRVKAVNVNGSSTYSNSAQNQPLQSTDVYVTSGNGHNYVYWVPSYPFIQTGFVVERCTGTWNQASVCPEYLTANWTNISGTLSSTVTSYDDATVSVGTTYVYRVRAFNSVSSTYTITTGSGFNNVNSKEVMVSPAIIGEGGYYLGFGGNTAQSQVTTSAAANDVTAPTVAVTAPTGGATVSGTYNFTVTCTDNVAVSSVLLRFDGIGYDTPNLSGSSPFTFSVDTTKLYNGTHVVDAICVDNAIAAGSQPLNSQYVYGNESTATAVSFTVNNAGGILPASCSISSPTVGATLSGTITVSGACTPGQGTCSPGTQFTVDGGNISTAQSGTTPSVSWNTNIGNGPHTLGCSCTDSGGGTGSCTPVSITVSNVGSTTNVTGSSQSSVTLK